MAPFPLPLELSWFSSFALCTYIAVLSPLHVLALQAFHGVHLLPSLPSCGMVVTSSSSRSFHAKGAARGILLYSSEYPRFDKTEKSLGKTVTDFGKTVMILTK